MPKAKRARRVFCAVEIPSFARTQRKDAEEIISRKKLILKHNASTKSAKFPRALYKLMVNAAV
jgi:hypothetical protein